MKKFLSLVLALVMTMSLVTISAGAKDFTDDSAINYDEAVDVLSALKIVGGDTTGAFNPQGGLTRGAAAKIICNLILSPTTAGALNADTAPYKDVPVGSTYAGYIAYCAQQGIVSGYTDGTFRPAAPLTGYAFMKMLLGALGYDAAVEGYSAPNWSIAVAKRALGIGLDNGLADDFVGAKNVTREEAALYAFNALKADLVEYDSTTNITIGGTAVVVGGSKAQKIEATKIAGGPNYKGYNTTAANNDEYVQFCERYFSDLKLTNVSDDFERPANEWKVKTTKVGTYSKTPDLTYTKKVKSGAIYADLGLGDKVLAANVTAYTDGLASGNSDIAKNGTYEYGKNGVKTEVYLNDAGATNTITICMTNTWIGEVTKVKDATKTADRAITVSAYGGSATPTGFATHNTEETEDFEIEDVVLYTYSRKVGSEGIKSLTIPETVTGTLTARTAGDDFTVDGTTYEYSAKANNEADGITMKSEITAYLDTYGYSIFEELSKEADSHYAYVLGTGKQGNTSYSTDFYATLFLAADGTVVTVPTKKNYVDAAPTGEGNYTNKVVSYTVDKDGKYTLSDKTTTSNAANPIDIKRGEAAMTILGGTTYANSKTTFLVRTGSAGNYKYSVYTGIANVPTIKNLANAQVATYCKTVGMATVVYVDAVGSAVTTSKDDVVYVLTSSQSNLKTNSDGTDYYVYDAIVNGEITKLSVAQGLVDGSGVLASGCTTSQTKAITGSYVEAGTTKTTSALVFSGMSLDNDNIVTSFVDATAKMYKATNTSRTSGGAVIFGGTPRTAAEDIKVFFMDEAGDLGATTTSSIANDANDEVLFFFDDGEVSSALILNKVNP